MSTVSLTAALLLLLTGPAAFAAPHVAVTKDDKPADLTTPAPRVAFDCSNPVDVLSLAPDDAGSFTGDTTDSENVLEGYACRLWSETGPEHIYELNVTEDLELWAGLSDLGEGEDAIDLDLFLLSDCDTDACLAGENLEFSVSLTAGTYYLIVDGFGYPEPFAGPYTLSYECRWPGVPPAVCEPGIAIDLNCGVQTVEQSGDLFDQPNRIQSYDCSPFIERGGEIWYAVSLWGYHGFTATVTDVDETLDVALWVFDGCGAEAVCLGFADDETAGQSETVSWEHGEPDGATVYVGVDCLRAPSEAGLGTFTVEFACSENVANERRSLGSLRALYR